MGQAMIMRRGGSVSKLPKFTYTGDYSIVNEKHGNWKIYFYTSGTLTFTEAPGACDLFLVGGGAGSHPSQGGSGGRTGTFVVTPAATQAYAIVVGAGGAAGTGDGCVAGGATTAFSQTVNGATKSYYAYPNWYYSVGGSGGGAGKGTDNNAVSCNGASDGGNGQRIYKGETSVAGVGQGTTTREFGEPDGKLYAGGGGGYPGALGGDGGGGDAGADGTVNTGGGAGGGKRVGGSGIAVLRNHRAAA